MKLGKRFAAAILVGALAVTTVFVPGISKAQIKYDPVGNGNGIYIDTIAVPNDDNIKLTGEGASKMITAIPNVSFKLYCSVDASWSIRAQELDKQGDDEATNPVLAGLVQVDEESGVVKIQPGDEKEKKLMAGNYTITATPENVEDVRTATITLKVNAERAAKATDIKWSKSLNAHSQMTVSDDGKKLAVDGRVVDEALKVSYTPSYLVDNTVTFTNDTTSSVYTMSGNRITTVGKTESGAKVTVKVGQQEQASNDLDIAVTEKDFETAVTCVEDGSDAYEKDYKLERDRELNFLFTSNEDITLSSTDGIEDLKWEFKQDNSAIEPVSVTEDGVEYSRYSVKATGADGSYEFAQIDVPVGGVSAMSHMRVRTVIDDSEVPLNVKVDAVSVNLTPKNSDGREPKTIHFRLTFSPGTMAKVTGAVLNFRKDPTLAENFDFSIKTEKDIAKDGEVEVFYFESSDMDDINLTTAIVPNEVGVRSFEESRDKGFAGGSSAAYTIQCKVTDVETLAKEYNNKELKNGNGIENNILTNNRMLSKKGIGYKKLTVQCMKGLDPVSENVYYIRYVSPADQNEYKIPNGGNSWYNYVKEVVHVRKGEAVVPRFYKDSTNEAEQISVFNPCIEYKFDTLYSQDDKVIATASRDESTYRVNGMETGIVKVTAVGAVDKSNTYQFELYVNKDTYAGDFRINFNDAILDKTMDTNYVIDGRQESVLVGITAEGNTGIPDIEWSLAWKDEAEKADLSEYAVIKPGTEPGTAVITTKIYSNKEINVIATVGEGEDKIVRKSAFTIAQVGITSIATLAEKVDGTAVVIPNGDNAGKCMVGQSFTLYPADYEPKNANDLLSAITWESSDEKLATVDKEGKVTALATTGEGTVQIMANCRSGGGGGEDTIYRLTIEPAKVPVTAIEASDFDLEYKSATLNMAGRIKILPENASDPTVTYKSSDEKIVAVDEKTGQLTANAIGSCTITVTSVSNPDITKTITVTVKGQSDHPVVPTPPAGVTPGTPVVPGTNVTPGTIVTPGIPVTPGTTVKSDAGQKVKAPVIKLAKSKIKRKKSTKITIANKAKGAKVTYKLDKKSKKIVSVSKNGKIKGKKKGTAKIVVTVKQNGKTYKKTLKIKVTK